MLDLNIIDKKKKIDTQMTCIRPQLLAELMPISRDELDEATLEQLREIISKKIRTLDVLPFEVQRSICNISREIGTVDAISVESRFVSRQPLPRYDPREANDDSAFEGEFDSFAIADTEPLTGRAGSNHLCSSEEESSSDGESSERSWNRKKARK